MKIVLNGMAADRQQARNLGYVDINVAKAKERGACEKGKEILQTIMSKPC